jgi:hypothetical protein
VQLWSLLSTPDVKAFLTRSSQDLDGTDKIAVCSSLQILSSDKHYELWHILGTPNDYSRMTRVLVPALRILIKSSHVDRFGPVQMEKTAWFAQVQNVLGRSAGMSSCTVLAVANNRSTF